jgi:hydrogenase nickel incorporation protein HypA/HybF
MHEMALCEGVLAIIAEEAKRHNFARVRVVRLEIGKLGHVEPQALRFCFGAVSRGTIAESARVELIDVPGEAWCMRCSKIVAVTQRLDPCPVCGGYQLQVTAGDDLRVKDLEVD